MFLGENRAPGVPPSEALQGRQVGDGWAIMGRAWILIGY